MDSFISEYGSLIAEVISASAIISITLGILYPVIVSWITSFITEVI